MKNEFGDKFDSSAPHWVHSTGLFQNYWDSFEKIPWYQYLLCFIFDINKPKAINYESKDESSINALEYKTIDWDKINSFNNDKNNLNSINYLWFGHSSCLIQVNGFNILTDPIFSDRCSATQLFGPKRYDKIHKYRNDIYDNIPVIDIVIISHDHYDHLDYNTINKLNKLNKINYFAVPLRIKSWLINKCNINQNKIIELDWYYSTIINQKGFNADEFKISRENIKLHNNCAPHNYGTDDFKSDKSDKSDKSQRYGSSDENDDLLKKNEIKIICVPTQHFSGRHIFDKNYRLWCGWLIISNNNKKIYFGGDTGCCSVPRIMMNTKQDNLLSYNDSTGTLKCCPIYEDIGNKYGPIDLGLIPIGAYSPRWFMSRIHLNPYDSCFVHNKLKCIKSIGIHWGSFYLTDEDYDQPPQVLKKAMKKYNINQNDFIVVKHGSVTVI